MNQKLNIFTHRFITLSLFAFVLLLLGCNSTEAELAEPTPKPVVAATEEVAPTAEPEPTATPEPAVDAEPTPIPEPSEEPKPTVDPENDGTLLKIPVMQAEPFVIDFEEAGELMTAKGIGPIAPASSVNFKFTGYPGQTFTAQTEGGAFGNALILNGNVVPITKIQGRANVWELDTAGEYEFSLSNGGSGANYIYEFSLTKASEEAAAAPTWFRFGQGIAEKTLSGETTGSDPTVFLFDGIEGQLLTISLTSESSKFVVINEAASEIRESGVGTTALDLDPLPNNGQYRIEVSAPSAEPFELTVTLNE